MFWLLLGLGINIAVHWLWFFTMVPLTHADAIYILPQTFKEFLNFSIWQSNSNIGGFDFVPSFYPFNFVAAVIASLGGGTNLIQRVIFFWPIVIFGTLTSYLLAYSLTKHKLGSFIATLVFNFNTFFIISSSGHITLSVAYTIFPLILYLYHRFINSGKSFYIPLISLVLFACSFWEFRAFYVVTIVISIMYSFELLNNSPRIKGWRNLVRFFSPVLLVLVFNMYWLLPIITDTQKEVLSVVAGRSLFKGGTENANMLVSAFTLFHLMWSSGKIIPFSVNEVPMHFFIVPLVAFSVLIFYRKKPTIIFYASLALLGLMLGKFFFPPFPSLYEWIFRHVPGFGAFREPSKFTVIIYLSYSVLIAFFVKFVYEKVKAPFVRNVIISILAAVFLSNAIPIITTQAGALFTPRNMPDDYTKLNKFIDEQPDFFRTLWIPRDSRWGIYTNTHPKINAVSLIESKYLDQGMVGSISELIKKTNETFMTSKSDVLLDALSIKYVVIPLQDIENDDDFYQDYGSREYYTGKIKNNTSLIRKDLGLKDVLVYENLNYKEHIYSDNENLELKTEALKPYHYVITFNKPKKETTIYFSESYHPGWKLTPHRSIALTDAVLDNNYFLQNISHMKTQFSTNSYIIDPADFIEDKIVLSLYFTPQIYSIYGSYVSLISLGGTILAAVYLFVKKK